ncbi:MAG: NAD-dependent epimerase/dehydratase family protein [Candidatus Aminicenantes bacterium]|nr:NAD-dependent epimerase/dehydratase family protein [Acidobacteriota bacterium]MBU4404882.1 NAD-dependent epimerase/dehydratase family protein [Acidobacteriota bacterium]MCG2812859.1 NAD-dependent epimerase/dehydratase family protein [Candidatus Aminicenantes bacterium]
MKALVTGGSGFIGRHLVADLLRRDHEVRCLARPATDRGKLAGLPVAWAEGAFDDPTSLAAAVAGVDWVFHLAAAITAADRPAYVRANVRATAALLQACADAHTRIRRFVFASSIAASGPTLDKRLQRENDPCRPVSEYGRSKLLAEEACRRFSGQLPITVLRLTNVLGVDQAQLSLARKLLQLRLMPLLGNGDEQTSLVFVQDAVAALLLAAEEKAACGRTYFVADGGAYSWRTVFSTVRRAMDIGAVLYLPHPLLILVAAAAETAARLRGRSILISRGQLRDLRRYYYLHDIDLIRSELGFRPRFHFNEETFRRLFQGSPGSAGLD